MIKICRVEARPLCKPFAIVECHVPIPEGHQAIFSEAPQCPVYMNGAKPKCVSQMMLSQRAVIA